MRTLNRRETLRLTGAGLSLIAVCYGLARFAYGLFVPSFRAEFALDAVTAGAVASGSYASYCVAIVVSMLLTPRFGGRTLAIAAGTTATVGVLLIAAAPQALVLAIGVIVAGSSTGVASPPLAHAVAHTVRTSVRDRTQTVVNAGTGLGVAIAGPVALLTHEHWRAAWLVFAALCAVVTAWAAIAVPTDPSDRSARGAMLPALPRPLLPAGSGTLIAASALMGVASSAVWTFGRDVLISVGGMDQTESTFAWIVLGVFGVLGAAAGDVTGRFGTGAGWTATMLLLGVATGLLACVPSLAWLAVAAFGASYIALTGVLLVWGTAVYPRTPAAGVGLAFLAIALGQSAGAPLVVPSSRPGAQAPHSSRPLWSPSSEPSSAPAGPDHGHQRARRGAARSHSERRGGTRDHDIVAQSSSVTSADAESTLRSMWSTRSGRSSMLHRWLTAARASVVENST